MSATAANAGPIPWWKEPTKDQWLAWLGWTLDAFDFTIFLLLMVPIAKDFGVPLTEVAVVFTLTLWMRLVGATASGWLADRIGRKKPLMISIAWFSVCSHHRIELRIRGEIDQVTQKGPCDRDADLHCPHAFHLVTCSATFCLATLLSGRYLGVSSGARAMIPSHLQHGAHPDCGNRF